MSPAGSLGESSNWKPTKRTLLNGLILLSLLCLIVTANPADSVHATSPTDCSPSPEFHIDVSPDHLILLPGMSADATVTVTPRNGFRGTITLGAVNVPPEITNPNFGRATLDVTNGAQTSTVSFGISSTAAIGLYSLDVNATTNGSLYHYASISVRIPGPEIGISSDKLQVHLPQGSSDVATITLTSLYGFAGTLDLTATLSGFHSRTPPTATVLPRSPSLVNGESKTSMLTIFADQYATPGSYIVQVMAQSSSAAATNSTQVLVEVQGQDFTLKANPPVLIIVPFSSKTISLEVNSTMNFEGTVALSAGITSFSGTPPTATLSNQTVTLTSGQHFVDTVTFTATGLGSFIANITGISGLLAHSTLISLDVREVRGFFLTPTHDTLAIDQAGPSASSQITVKSDNLADSVNLAIACYPDELTANLSSSSVILNPGTSATVLLTVSATRFTTPGIYGVSIFGAGMNSLSHNRTFVTVTVISTTPDFDMSSSPGAVTITAGDKATTRIIINPKYGFTDTVNLSITSPPGVPTASLGGSTIIGGSGSTILTVDVASTISAGTYTVTVQGSSGSLSHSVQVTLTVNGRTTTQQTSPATILGLAPNLFYVTASLIFATIVAGVGVATKMRKPKTSSGVSYFGCFATRRLPIHRLLV